MDNTSSSGVVKFLQLSDLKRLLLSRDINFQLKAVTNLHRFLQSNHGEVSEQEVEAVISADIVEILCECLSTLNTALIEQIISCLGLLSNYSCFFENHHTMYVVDSVLRCLYVLSAEKSGTIFIGLQLFSEILCKLNQRNSRLESLTDISQVLQLISKLMKEHTHQKIINSVAELVINYLQQLDLNWKDDFEKKVQEIISGLIVLLTKMEDKSESVLLIAEMLNSYMRLFIAKNDSLEAEFEERRSFIESLRDALYKIVIPYITAMDLKTIGVVATVLLRSVLSFYYNSKLPSLIGISNYLASQDFLTLLPMLETWSRNNEFLTTTRSILCEMLINLCETNLGPYSWRETLVDGFSDLPLGFFSRSHTFIEMAFNVQSTIIVYNYFYLLTFSRPKSGVNMLNALYCYLLGLKDVPSDPILKAVWFSLAVPCSSQEKCVNFNRGQKKLMALLGQKKNLKSVYTHHFVILHWAFLNRTVPQDLQKEVVYLWLHSDDENSMLQLEEIALECNKLSNILVEMMSSVRGDKSLKKLFDVISLLLSKKDTQLAIHTTVTIWATLPKLLALFNLQFVENITFFLTLCSENIPSPPDTILLLKMSCLVPSVVLKYYKMNLPSSNDVRTNRFFSVAFHFITILLQLLRSKNELKGLKAILRFSDFLKVIESCLLSCDQQLCFYSIDLLSVLVHYQTYYSLKCETTLKLSTANVVRMLTGERPLVQRILSFFSTFLSNSLSEKEAPFLELVPPTSTQLRSLYIQLHMICFKETDDISANCWKCIHQLLLYSSKLSLQNHLATLPFTQQLVLLSSPGTNAWFEMINFLPDWLLLLPLLATMKRLALPDSEKTINKLVENLISHSSHCADPRVHSAILKIVKIEALPENIKSFLRAKLL